MVPHYNSLKDGLHLPSKIIQHQRGDKAVDHLILREAKFFFCSVSVYTSHYATGKEGANRARLSLFFILLMPWISFFTRVK